MKDIEITHPLSINEHAESFAAAMIDWNYIPTIGALEIDGANSLDDIKQAIKRAFPRTEPSEERFTISTKEEMFEDLRQCFSYDETPNSDVTARDIPKETVKQEQEVFLRRLETYIKADSEIVAPGIESGLPISYIFWIFGWVIFNKGGKSLFLYGAASD